MLSINFLEAALRLFQLDFRLNSESHKSDSEKIESLLLQFWLKLTS